MSTNFYKFPVIKSIDDLLPHLKNNPEFIVAERGDYKIVNYMVHKSDTFSHHDETDMRFRRECRGIVFDKNGDILSRRFHKFFNVGEKEETLSHNIDLTQPHVILDKLDGSMITPLFYNGEVHWATKMGDNTDVAISASKYANSFEKYNKLAKKSFENGYTPIFEWCSRKNRIVIDYPEDQLILTAIRNNLNGNYKDISSLNHIGGVYDIPVVKSYGDIKDINEFIERIRYDKGIEGFIVRFNNGHMLKIKCDEYVICHRSQDTIAKPRHVVQAILNGTVDDLKAYVIEDDKVKLDKIEKTLWSEIDNLSDKIAKEYKKYYTLSNGDRKTFALEYQKSLDKFISSGIFWVWNERSSFDYVKNYFVRASNADIDWLKFVEQFNLDKELFIGN